MAVVVVKLVDAKLDWETITVNAWRSVALRVQSTATQLCHQFRPV